jgi:hypothetical protein
MDSPSDLPRPRKRKGRRPKHWDVETPALLYWPAKLGSPPAKGRSVAMPAGTEEFLKNSPAGFDDGISTE